MRILSRPMFRYGGPIKEGLMHGMKNGGLSKQFNTGLVGDERYPKTGGREHHGFFIPPLWAAATGLARFAPSIYRAAQAAKNVGTVGSRVVGAGQMGTGHLTGQAGKALMNISQPLSKASKFKNWAKGWWGGDPTVKSAKWGWGTLTSPTAKGLGQKVFKGVTSPTGLLTAGSLGWMFWPDGTPKTGDALAKAAAAAGKKPGRGDEGMYYDKPPVTKTAEELAAEAKAARTKKLNKYLDTMGYDKAKKTAIGDALIDASAIVQQGTEEGGSLKHADWSKMINQAIQATSQRLKKPEQIREAVGLMMTKADIQKDMNADDKALAKLLTSKKIEKLNKELEGNSFRENLIAITQKMPGQAGFDAAAQVTEGVDFKGNLINATDWTESLKKMQEDPTSTGLNEKQLIKLYAEKEIAGKGYEDGDYTVGNNLVTIKDDIVVAVE